MLRIMEKGKFASSTFDIDTGRTWRWWWWGCAEETGSLIESATDFREDHDIRLVRVSDDNGRRSRGLFPRRMVVVDEVCRDAVEIPPSGCQWGRLHTAWSNGGPGGATEHFEWGLLGEGRREDEIMVLVLSDLCSPGGSPRARIQTCCAGTRRESCEE